jgi:hypothetical protein
MKPLFYYGTVENGSIRGPKKDYVAKVLFKLEGKPVKVTIEQVRSQHSQKQRGWYRAVIIPAIQEGLQETQGLYLDADQVHWWLKRRFNGISIIDHQTGEEIDIVGKSTKELDTAQFVDYCERIRQFAWEFLNIHIPDPNTQAKLIF